MRYKKHKEFVLKISDVGAIKIINASDCAQDNFDKRFITPNRDGKEFNAYMAKLRRGSIIRIII